MHIKIFIDFSSLGHQAYFPPLHNFDDLERCTKQLVHSFGYPFNLQQVPCFQTAGFSSAMLIGFSFWGVEL